MMHGRLFRWLARAGCLLALLLAVAGEARALTYTVNTTFDPFDAICDASCTLREAITLANSNPGPDRIAFNIPGGGLRTLTITSALPDIEGDLEIDGYSQPGSQANTQVTGGLDTVLQVMLAGDGIVRNGLTIVGPHVSVRGLVINNFTVGIAISSALAEDVTIAGNFFGVDEAGTTALGGGSAIDAVWARATLTIGGPSPADRNLISGHTSHAIQLRPASDGTPLEAIIQGNLIGTDIAGMAPLGNGLAGIYVFWSDADAGSADDALVIGGATAALGNVISGNGQGVLIQRGSGAALEGASFTIASNRIGTTAAGGPLGNQYAGVTVEGGLSGTVERNFISHNGGGAVVINGGLADGGGGTLVRDNVFAQNGGLGIDLGGDGRTANDAGDEDTGPNDLLNFPVLTRAAIYAAEDTLSLFATVDAEAYVEYRLQLFRAPAARPAGSDASVLVAETPVLTDVHGHADVQIVLPANGTNAGDTLVATLIEVQRRRTSEISDAVVAVAGGPSLSGTITRDSGATPVYGVRVALSGDATRTAATNASGEFLFADLPEGGTFTLTPQSLGYTWTPANHQFTNLTTSQSASFDALPVPAVYTVDTTADIVDNGCQPGSCSLREAIEEANAHPGLDRINFAIPGAGPHAIVLNDVLPPFVDAVLVDGYSQPGARPNSQVTGGLDSVIKIALVAGPDLAGGLAGAVHVFASRVTVRGLSMTGFGIGASVLGLDSTPLASVSLEGNYFGIAPDGSTTSADQIIGVYAIGAVGLTVGGSTPASRNLISGHGAAGVSMVPINPAGPSTIVVRGNLIGTDATGMEARPNLTGIDVQAGGLPHERIHIGGPGAFDGNLISGNDSGIYFVGGPDEESVDHVIEGNTVGLAADGATALGNTYEGLGLCGELLLTARRNVIAHNAGAGINFCGWPTLAGAGVEFAENRIFDNFGLAIDLEADGRTPNDPDDSDTGSNDLQNFPELSVVSEQLDGARVNGVLMSRPSRQYRVELFSTGGVASLGEQAREFLASLVVTTDENGMAAFSYDLPGAFPLDEQFAATATDIVARMTSEVSDSVGMTLLARTDLTGTVTHNGAPLANVTVRLAGGATLTTQTDASGHYAFAALRREIAYTVTPEAAGYLFTPASASFPTLPNGATADFAAANVTYTRHLPEGAAGSFWETTISLLNPGTQPATAEVTFLKAGGPEHLSVPISGPGHVTIDPATIPALNGTSFSTVITSTAPLAASRTMRWGTQRELGAHAEQAIAEPSTTWYFAEGATACFDLFYLIGNPGDQTANVDVTFVRRAPLAPITNRYVLGPHTRATLQANTEDGLASAEISARFQVANGQPIVVERSMYSSCYGAAWRGGHDAVGSPAPAQEWFFAEGATGSFFDLYLLLANFETQEARVDVDYLFSDGSRLTRPHTVPAGSRITIDVAGESPLLANATVSAVVRSKNGVPVVAERSQWWPHGNWYEGHVSAGVTQSGVEWQVAGAAVGGSYEVNGYLLIANTGDHAGQASVRAVFADGSSVTLAQPVALAAHSRATLDLADAFPQARGQIFGLIVESTGATPAPIVVELSSYNDTRDGASSRFWGAGTNIVATRIR